MPGGSRGGRLKGQAKGPVKAGAAITAPQFQIARLYTFANQTKLKAYVGSVEEIGQLKQRGPVPMRFSI